MDDVTAMLAGICAEPGDDLPRLVLADYLEEQGEHERAEFIRVQCELAKPHKCPGTSRNPERCGFCFGTFPPESCKVEKYKLCAHRAALRKREEELWNGDRSDGTRREGVAQHFIRLVPEGWQVRYWLSTAAYPSFAFISRGFVSRVTLSAADWLAHHARLCWPWGECGKCGGSGYTGGEKKLFGSGCAFSCPRCSGRGRCPPTDECPECKGRRYAKRIARGGTDKVLKQLECKLCSGSGRVPHPCPPTAQPLTDVHFTTPPGFGFGDWNVNPDATFTSDRWPGITFHLPQTFEDTPLGHVQAAQARHQRRR